MMLAALSFQLAAQAFLNDKPLVTTFSIIAKDTVTGEIAVAVQSHWFSVGTTVSWAEGGIGAVATQSFANKNFGPEGLKHMRDGMNAKAVLDKLINEDEGKDFRQVGIIDNNGNIAVFTGDRCLDDAGHISGNHYAILANLMANDSVWHKMDAAYQANMEKPLAERIIEVLKAGQEAGGDLRGRQSAAMKIVKGKSSKQPWNDVVVDLRVDDHHEPIAELERLYKVHKGFQYMNQGDLAAEAADVPAAISAYENAEKLLTDNLEPKFWHAVMLYNNNDSEKAQPLLHEVFSQDKNWAILFQRLPKSGLLNLGEEEIQAIVADYTK